VIRPFLFAADSVLDVVLPLRGIEEPLASVWGFGDRHATVGQLGLSVVTLHRCRGVSASRKLSNRPGDAYVVGRERWMGDPKWVLYLTGAMEV
jgi:hypothetical protein